jgi:hypothetical protein
MAHPTVAVLHAPNFHSIFSSAALDRYTSDVGRMIERAPLPPCSYEYPEYRRGACDGEPYSDKGTVHDLASDQEYCAKHFREVSRG